MKYINVCSDGHPVMQSIRERCLDNPGRLALPEIKDDRVLAAARQLLEEHAVVQIHTCLPERSFSPEMRQLQSQGGLLSWEQSLDQLKPKHRTSIDESPLIAAGRLLESNVVDAVLAGAVYNTADVIRAAISTTGLVEGNKTVSGSFLMLPPKATDPAFLYADCGVVIEPTAEQLRDIARMSLLTWRVLVPDVVPVVACLSFSTKGSAQHPSAEKMAQLATWLKHEYPELEVEGEIQFDAAINAEVGKRKCPDSRVPGHANIFIFPNLDAGNIAYKITQRLAGYRAYGPILQGNAKPYSDLSRGVDVHDIIMSAYINLVRRLVPNPAL